MDGIESIEPVVEDYPDPQDGWPFSDTETDTDDDEITQQPLDHSEEMQEKLQSMDDEVSLAGVVMTIDVRAHVGGMSADDRGGKTAGRY